MKFILFILACFWGIQSVLAFPSKTTMVYFHTYKGFSNCHFLSLEKNGRYSCYCVDIIHNDGNKNKDVKIVNIDSMFGKWYQEGPVIHFLSDDYLDCSPEERQILLILVGHRLMDDSVDMKIVDECTLEMIHPEYSGPCYKSIDCISSNPDITKIIDLFLAANTTDTTFKILTDRDTFYVTSEDIVHVDTVGLFSLTFNLSKEMANFLHMTTNPSCQIFLHLKNKEWVLLQEDEIRRTSTPEGYYITTDFGKIMWKKYQINIGYNFPIKVMKNIKQFRKRYLTQSKL